MITYKGQRTVIGKRFIYEGEILKYTGKIYGDNYNFINNNGIEYILSESELSNLEDYELSEADSNIINNMTDKDTIKSIIINYTEQELALINDILVGKSNNINALNALYEKELNELMSLNKYSMPKPNTGYSLEAQKSYLNDLNRNISSANIVSLLTNLQTFIASNKEGETNGTI